jgi:hypothetical protein
MNTLAFAVVLNDQIDVKTVSPSYRAATVNWLVVNKGKMIYDHHTDEHIEGLWQRYKGRAVVEQIVLKRKSDV